VERVYLTKEQALQQAFPTSDAFQAMTRTLPAMTRSRIERRIGFRLRDSVVTITTAKTRGALDGYAMVLDEKGKYYPITFLVATDRMLRVRSVHVLVYREKRGDAVRREKFLRQFAGKGPRDAIAVDRDIVHISGATLSSWAVAAGVRRAVAILDELYGNGSAERR
jgi:Na+-translocating ferredoxin:NAD+ oxidoreductase RnfG subunit